MRLQLYSVVHAHGTWNTNIRIMEHGFIDIKGSCVIDINSFTMVPTFNLKLILKRNKRMRAHWTVIEQQWLGNRTILWDKFAAGNSTGLNPTTNLQQFLLITKFKILLIVHIHVIKYALIMLYFGITILNSML